LLPPIPALAATVCLDGLVFFQAAAAEFNNQVLLIACWALAVWLFHRATQQDHWRDWIGTGLALGLALLCKYSAGFLILPLLGWWLYHNGLRRWSRPGVVAAMAALVFLPHLVWLCRHDFPTLRYAVLRAQGESGAFDHRLSAVTFLLSQGLRLAPVVLILLPLLTRHRRLLTGAGERDRAFVMVVVLGPVVLHLLASLVVGLGLRDIWGAPLWTFTGVLLLGFLQTKDLDLAWRRFCLTWGCVAGGSVLMVVLCNLMGGYRGKPLRIHYPGPRLAAELTQRWRAAFATPLPIAAGDWWLAGNVCCHSVDRPCLYGSLEPAAFGLDLDKEKGDTRRFANPDPRTSPWTGDADLCRRGGVLLWDARCYGSEMPAWLRQRFPMAQAQPPLVLPCAGGGPVGRVGWAMIAPSKEDRRGHPQPGKTLGQASAAAKEERKTKKKEISPR
jgi:hypothetical protein